MLPKVLITGGAGYKGTVLADLLHRRGYAVTLFDCFRWGEEPVLHLARQGVDIVRGDIVRADDVARVIKDHDVIVHLASLVGYPICREHPDMAEEVNVGGTKNLIGAMSPRQSLLFASTGSVYGKIDGLCVEDTPPEPLTLYGKTKLEAEAMVLDFGGVAFRFASLFGVSPCMRFDLLVNAFVYQAIHQHKLELYRPGDRRTFMHVDDSARCYLLAIENYEKMRGDVFNAGDESLNCTKHELAELIAEHVPMELTVAGEGEDPDHRDYAVSYEKLRQRIGFTAETDLKTGISQIVRVAQFCKTKPTWRLTL